MGGASQLLGIGVLSLSMHLVLSSLRYLFWLVVSLSKVLRNIVSLKQSEIFEQREPVESRGRHARSKNMQSAMLLHDLAHSNCVKFTGQILHCRAM